MAGNHNYITWLSCFSAEADGSLVCGHFEEGAPFGPQNQEGVIQQGKLRSASEPVNRAL